MNHPTIKFSHRYTKMPNNGTGIEHMDTYIRNVYFVYSNKLTPETIKQDTEIVGGGHYMLPSGKLIWIELWTDTVNGGHLWQTIRPYNQEKFEYYKSLKGKQVDIVVLSKTPPWE